ncbi:hypothetical protein HPB48_002212 [Haemaphysalis longicornis]|uniref:Uncharacterized protein n=1 Tax=Haemaphysalis longicornis TaxID=44386 RepID=A0A9J6FGM3_HAELO|nr:hypothetical protein HPB48_002212 [Haemaphysalis longicornis]
MEMKREEKLRSSRASRIAVTRARVPTSRSCRGGGISLLVVTTATALVVPLFLDASVKTTPSSIPSSLLTARALASRLPPCFRFKRVTHSLQDSQRPLVRVTGFGPLITDSLGAIHTYITGLILRPPSPGELYPSLPPVQHDAERRLCTQSAGSPAAATTVREAGSAYGCEQLLAEPEYPASRF